MTAPEQAGDLQWGIAVPKADGFINPSQVISCNNSERADYKAAAYGSDYVVVSRPMPAEWEVANCTTPPESRSS